MAPKKKQTRKGGAISEHDRRNLELMYQSYYRMALMFANVALMIAVLGWIASLQLSGAISDFIVFVSFFNIVAMMIFAIYHLIRAKRIAKKLGVEETAEKYDV